MVLLGGRDGPYHDGDDFDIATRGQHGSANLIGSVGICL